MLGVHEPSCRYVELACRHQCRRDRASSWEIFRKQEQEHTCYVYMNLLVVPLSSCVATSVEEIVSVPGRSLVNKNKNTHVRCT